jgi:EAL domain-containing protein (putative c-di-GMP-specific phosphodiesterase class I)
MGMQLIIQGVEEVEQMAILKRLGCTLLQGAQIGSPLDGKEVVTQLDVEA